MESPCLFTPQQAFKLGYFYWLHVKNLISLHAEFSLRYLEDAKFYLESKLYLLGTLRLEDVIYLGRHRKLISAYRYHCACLYVNRQRFTCGEH